MRLPAVGEAKSIPLIGASLLALIAVAGCKDEAGSSTDAGPFENSAQAGRPFSGWGSRILELVPERGSDSLLRFEAAQRVFAACGLGDGRLSGKCDMSTGRLPANQDGSTVNVTIQASGESVRAVVLSACCSTTDDFFHPFDGVPVIRSELICPELTISASESVQAFRVSAPGKRDFVIMRTSHASGSSRSAIVAVSLLPVQSGDECAALANASGDQVEGDPGQTVPEQNVF